MTFLKEEVVTKDTFVGRRFIRDDFWSHVTYRRNFNLPVTLF